MMLTDDKDLRPADIQSLSNRNEIASFFLKLGYNIDDRVEQIPSALGITNDSLLRQIRYIERIANQDDLLEVYLVELKSMRVADRQALARTFRNRGIDFLFVLTADYDSLDFVLLEQIAPIAPSDDGGPATSRRQNVVRPRVLTVERQNPGAVALRVLRRFSYTEVDPVYQYEKLLSAYTVAEWSEPLFNNRALFSDYYLKERLTTSPEWSEKPEPIYRKLQSLMANTRQRLTDQNEAATRAELLEPIFEVLGFTWEVRRESGQASDNPDYVMLQPSADHPLAVCLAYKWNRYLDGSVAPEKDPDTPNENPGAQVVTLLERGDAAWAIVTNGKVWRLYAAAAHSRATNYYEIDLEEALASPDRADAIRYFWLFFRARAFVPQEVVREGETRLLSFLDRMMEDSQVYAKKLGDRLKDRVFEEIFPHFAEGFIEYIRQREGKDATIKDRLDTIYQGTLTFLYRLMFLLYAESRDLLPVKEVRGYWEVSLDRLKREIAERAANILDEAPDRLRKAYRADSYDLYKRLNRLFQVIDQGDASLNVPRYNGGLFITIPNDDDTQEQITARFLRDHQIPDRFLVLGLDRLARDLDVDKTQMLVMIDFKSLGVRQLGSIYEGLLEFKLRIAPEKMAIVKGKRTEEIVLYRDAPRGKILKAGRGQNAVERTLPKGKVYLENTRQERKATGSYYTPNYIVEYIVEHTVGPVLEEKFEALRPRLREAERGYHTAMQNARAKSKLGSYEDPEKFWNHEDRLRLAYDVLDIKVLDPAMGSGHFLVEAVDFITDRMLNFLNGFPHNPVRAALQRTRSAILESMESQGVSIDQGRLNDVALLKRQVLKRCVYGVDLNHMAVELAKVSLWLDAFTLGAPLSFLDHHLRWGNSLIGAMARDADAELREKTDGQLALWGGPFVGLLRSAEIMRGIGMLADATIEQAQESANLFHEFEEAARPYKQLLDVFVIRHFGVKRADEFLRLYGADVMTADPESSKLAEPYKEVLRARKTLYEQYRFFHWDLEFPEVFIDLDWAAWKENAGFDAVIGNPPYVRPHNLEGITKTYLQLIYNAFTHKSDLFVCFFERAIRILRNNGITGLITSDTWLYLDSFDVLRRMLLDNGLVTSLVPFVEKDVFEDAAVRPVVVTYQRCAGGKRGEIALLNPTAEGRFVHVAKIDQQFFEDTYKNVFDLSLVGRVPALKEKVKRSGPKLGQTVSIDFGLKTGDDSRFLSFGRKSNKDKPLIRGNDTYRYFIEHRGEYVHYDPQAMINHRSTARPGEAARFEADKILVKDTSSIGFNCTFDDEHYYAKDMLIVRALDNIQIELIAICGILNSKLMKWYYETTFPTVHVQRQELASLPLPNIDFSTPIQDRAQLVVQALDLYVRSLTDGYGNILAFTDERLAANQTDVIHDLLAFLAQQMIDLNKQKQAEVRRFLGWLEAQIGAAIDDLTGKTILQGYLGDYQKGEDHRPFEDLYDRLHNNRSKIAANLSDKAFEARLRQEYEASLGVLLPIKQQLAHTDRLIDLIVYKLYGLTDDEIAIVEGRA